MRVYDDQFARNARLRPASHASLGDRAVGSGRTSQPPSAEAGSRREEQVGAPQPKLDLGAFAFDNPGRALVGGA